MSRPSDEFLTPQPLCDLVKRIFTSGVDFDPYASPGQLIKSRDGLTLSSDPEPWPKVGCWFANIPFSESADVMAKLVNHFATNPSINALVLCLAAPSSTYWAETVWDEKIGARRIGWVPRMKFLRLDDQGIARATKASVSRDIALTLWTNEERLVKRFEQHVPPFNPGVRARKRLIKVSFGGRP